MSFATPQTLETLLSAHAVSQHDRVNVVALVDGLDPQEAPELVRELARALGLDPDAATLASLRDKLSGVFTVQGLQRELDTSRGQPPNDRPRTLGKRLSDAVAALPSDSQKGVSEHGPSMASSLSKAIRLLDLADWLATAELRVASMAVLVAQDEPHCVASTPEADGDTSSFITFSAPVESQRGASRRPSPSSTGESP